MTTNKFLKILSGLLFLTTPFAGCFAQEEIDLSGVWGFQADVMGFRSASVEIRRDSKLPQQITLPGITDDIRIGFNNPYKYTDRLSRKFEYMAPAWYQKEVMIPASWKNKRIFLYLERVNWLSGIYVGRKCIDASDYVSVPHIHELTQILRPGSINTINLMIDNTFQYDTHRWTHAHTENTQINWNGVLGQVKLIAVDPVFIEDMQVYPDLSNHSVKVSLSLINSTKKPVEGQVSFTLSGTPKPIKTQRSVALNDSVNKVDVVIPMGKKINLWDEFSPYLYNLACVLTTKEGGNRSEKRVTYGMREILSKGNDILLNGHRIHLRGNVGNAVFPETGYAPMDKKPWERIMKIMKSYGFNHLRFHTWCPPEACFEVADSMGIYLEVEMPMWGRDAISGDEARNNFFRREEKALLKTYGNHPSFLLYCNGNEMEGDFNFLNELAKYGRDTDNRHLYSGSTARKITPSDQFYVTHRTPKGGVAVYEGRPYTDWDANSGYGIGIPVISHETGQRCTYPDFREINMYKGPVEARNLEVYRDSLKAHGMLDQADDFFKVSSKQTAIEYKDVIEAQLRTTLSSGFQLLSLNDYTGQGYAPVGLFNSMWQSKGAIDSTQFRHFCAPTVPLLRFKKRTFFCGEQFSGQAEVYNYSQGGFKKPNVRWWVTDETGRKMAQGRIPCSQIGNYGVFPVGSFTYRFGEDKVPHKYTIHLSVNAKYENSWDVWVYPRHSMAEVLKSDGDILFTSTYGERAQQYLRDGKKVVLIPEPNRVAGRKSVFHNHFWNPIMFEWQPLTLGCLIHTESPVFKDFPTERNLDWQWFDIISNSKVIEMDDVPTSLRAFIQPIDTYAHNRKLGLGFEARIGKGRLLVLPLDIQKEIDQRPATQQLLYSIANYVRSSAFNPTVEVSEHFVQSFMQPSDKKEKEEPQDEFLSSFFNR